MGRVTKKTDYFCLLGGHPLDYGGLEFTVDQLLRELDDEGIEVAYVSPLEGFYCRDVVAVNEAFLSRIRMAGPRIRAVPLVDLSLGIDEQELGRFKAQGVRAVRIAPNFHGYQLTELLAGEFVKALNRYEMDFLVAAHLEDPRFQPACLGCGSWPLEQLRLLLQAGMRTRVICNNYDAAETMAAIAEFPANVYFDVAAFDKTFMTLEELVRIHGTDRLVFGSGRPILYPQAVGDNMRRALLDDATVKEIMKGLTHGQTD